jgi:tRNA (mo5U34)-methyltransferase
MAVNPADARAAVESNPLWYHTIEVAPGVLTPGWFDLRSVMDRIPWPDLRGKRCLDVATYDGSLAFEMERRGAAEVWATDVPNHDDWDWMPRERDKGVEYLAAVAGQKGRGFEIAAEMLGSKVQRRFVNVYDLDPQEMGQFDVVVCGSLLLHLRDPFRALAGIRRMCNGVFVSIEVFDALSSVIGRKRPILYLEGDEGRWTIPNLAGQRKMLEVAGFDVLTVGKPFAEPIGTSHPPLTHTLRDRLNHYICKGRGVPVRPIVCRPSTLS